MHLHELSTTPAKYLFQQNENGRSNNKRHELNKIAYILTCRER